MSEPYKHCEFGHLLTLCTPPVASGVPPYFGHVHEGEALHCAVLVGMGWPDAGVVR